MRLAGRTALVTGAGSGIGRAIAIRFAAEGARVIAADLRPAPAWDPDSLDPTAVVIERAGGRAEFVAADLTRPADVERAAAAAAAAGRVDILVNGAGIFGSSALLATTDAEWDQFMDVNLRSQFLACRAVIALMVAQEPDDAGVRGRVVNISSQLGVTGPPGHLAYAVSKAGVAHLTRQLAVEYARQGVLVNAVAPGRIITGTHPGERAYLEDGTVDAATAYSLSRTPFPRLGRPADVAGAALFLASDDCTFVSGHNLMVDGGWTAY